MSPEFAGVCESRHVAVVNGAIVVAPVKVIA